MPMVVHKYDFPGMTVAEEDVIAGAAQLNQIHDDITDGMNKLKASWKDGKDAAAWLNYQTAWNGIFADVQMHLTRLGQIVGLARDNAEETEKVNTAMWPDSAQH
jgi:uncharacterized protein YukE